MYPRKISRFPSDRGGNVAIIAAFVFLILTVAAGGAFDFTRAGSYRQKLQSAVDAGVLAGAAAGGDVGQARAMFDAEQVTGGSLKSVTFVVQPDGSVRGEARGVVDPILLDLAGIKTLPVKVTSRAGGAAPAAAPCVMLMSPSASQALLVNSGASVNAPDCEIHVKSTGSPAAIFNSGSVLTTKKICIQGASVIDNGGTHPNVSKSCATAADPYAGKIPAPTIGTCKSVQNINGATTLTPGCYTGDINPNQNNITLSPGVYVLKNSRWNIGAQLNGAGVTLYLSDASSYIQFNGSSSGTLTAPTSGAYSGILFFEPAGLSNSAITFNDKLSMTGVMYLPSRNVTFNASSALTARKTTMIFNTLILDQAKWTLTGYGGSSSSASGVPRLLE